jgi:hypothetical protein
MKTVFSVGSDQWLYKEDPTPAETDSVEAGSNTSTVTLRVVGGDEEGTQFLGA